MAHAARQAERGLRFDAGALIAVLAVCAAILGELVGGAAATLIALALFAAGVLHGAGDEDGAGIRPYLPIHAAGYVAFAAAIAALYLAAPLAGLAAFLIISAWHFATGRCDFGHASRYAIAGCSIGGSALFRPSQTAEIFATITGQAIPDIFMHALALAGLAALVCAGVAVIRRETGAGCAAMAVLAVILAGPVMAVALIFFVAHALPVHRRQIAGFGLERVVAATAWTGTIALIGAAGLVALVWHGVIAIPVAAAIAFGFATPHMLTEGV